MIRRPAAAGAFYPADPRMLARVVDSLLASALNNRCQTPIVKSLLSRVVDDRCLTPIVKGLRALVAPHAGYSYSGPVAASAFALVPDAGRVVLLGPPHFVPLDGIAASSADAWATPLGEVPIAGELRAAAVAGGAVLDDVPHDRDHALEVQLPFLQRRCREALQILPLAVGRSSAAEVADVLDALAALDALIVVSTDLSHYHPVARARELDRRTAAAILDLDPGAIADDVACGVFALRGLVEHARRRDLAIELLDLRTSADANGEAAGVVGYGAFAVAQRGVA